MSKLFYVLLPVYLALDAFAYRFQRTTLSVARLVDAESVGDIQIRLTPIWVAIVGWLSTGILIVLAVLAFRLFGWVWALIIVIVDLAGMAYVHAIVPFPSHAFCLRIVKSHLLAQARRSELGVEHVGEMLSILARVGTMEAEFRPPTDGRTPSEHEE